jgi:hypothetical protein
MPVPLVGAAAVAAASAVAKKLAIRAAGGIIGKGSKSINPVYRQVEVPKAPPGGKPLNPTPPKPPTSSSISKKPTHVAEKRDGAIGNKNPSVVKNSTPKKNPTKNKGPFSGDMARYNWTGN